MLREYNTETGLSPRLRGNPHGARSNDGDTGSIPRLRGNRVGSGNATAATRSIPAPAGEPATGGTTRRTTTVYPRACGGTLVGVLHQEAKLGLSPRLRGNRYRCDGEPLRMRSIPAPAGEPPSCIRQTPPTSVYPRACGGTGICRHRRARHPGLSPPPAGEPTSESPRTGHRRVYPRACGGTIPSRSMYMATPGLSPRLRGANPARRRAVVGDHRSIPAPAGEP